MFPFKSYFLLKLLCFEHITTLLWWSFPLNLIFYFPLSYALFFLSLLRSCDKSPLFILTIFINKIKNQFSISLLFLWFTFSSKAWAMNMLCWKWTLSSRVPCSNRNLLNLFQNINIILCSAVSYVPWSTPLQWEIKAHVLWIWLENEKRSHNIFFLIISKKMHVTLHKPRRYKPWIWWIQHTVPTKVWVECYVAVYSAVDLDPNPIGSIIFRLGWIRIHICGIRIR